jgi:hypothetical protein
MTWKEVIGLTLVCAPCVLIALDVVRKTWMIWSISLVSFAIIFLIAAI